MQSLAASVTSLLQYIPIIADAWMLAILMLSYELVLLSTSMLLDLSMP